MIDAASGKRIGEIGIQAVPGTIFVLGGRVWQAISFKGMSLYARSIAQKPEFKHFRRRGASGSFSRFLPENLREHNGSQAPREIFLDT